MFWRFGGYANISTIDTILDKPDVTLEELLDEADLIQELKQQNSKLIEYLRNEDVLERLLKYVVAQKPLPEATSPFEDEKDPSKGKEGFFGRAKGKAKAKSVDVGDAEEDKEEKQRLKYAYMAAEILSSEVYSISEALVENPRHLRTFWDYMKLAPPLDPLQAGYFTKVNESLFDKMTEQMVEFIKSIDGIVPALVQHVDCPSVMDLLLKVVSLEKADGGGGITDWLESQNLIPLLISYIGPPHNGSTQTSASDFIKAIITISANATTQDQSVIGPNELTRHLVSEECISEMVKLMLEGGNPLTCGVGIIIEVIRKNNSDYDLDNQTGPIPKPTDPIYLGRLLRIFANSVPDFVDLILNAHQVVKNKDGSEVKKPRELKTAFGEKIEPLGFDRFKTCELMAELLHCSNMALLNERGAEAEVRARDAERDRLKAEARLNHNQATSGEGEEYGTSVDSSGFHHAKAPSSALSESPDEIKRLEVQNAAADDGFEKITASEATPDNVRDAIEKQAAANTSSAAPAEETSASNDRNEHNEVVVIDEKEINDDWIGRESGGESLIKAGLMAANADSPTSAGVTDKLNGLDVSKDTTMASSPAADLTAADPENLDTVLASVPDTTQDTPMQGLSPHPDDTPAPLFSPTKLSHDAPSELSDSLPVSMSDSQSTITPSHAQESESVPLPETAEGDTRLPFEVDVDGSPVVGDLLKMMFVKHKVVPTILDFFFRFPWNNFLHNVVYDVVQQVFNGSMDRGYNRQLAMDLFETGRITERIIEGQQRSDEAQQKNNMRLGYMGHLTLIAEEVVKFSERHPPELLSEIALDKLNDASWIQYVDKTLAETRERDNAILGGIRPDSAGPRAAVMNAVNAAQGFGGSSGLAAAGLTGNGSTGLDSMDLANNASAGSGFNYSGGLLSSGFGSSSDEEDEEMEEGDREERSSHVSLLPSAPAFSAPPPASSDSPSGSSPSTSPSVPAPLNIPPSRARRQLALRLAQRKKEAEEGTASDPDAAATAAALDHQNQSNNNTVTKTGGYDDVSFEKILHELEDDSEGSSDGAFSSDEFDEEDLALPHQNTHSSPSAQANVSRDEDEVATELGPDPVEGVFELDDEVGMSPGSAGSGSERRRKGKGRRRKRRPSVTEAKIRMSLEEEDPDEEEEEEGLMMSASPRVRGMMAAAGNAKEAREREQEVVRSPEELKDPFADVEEVEDDEDEDEDGSDEEGEGLIEFRSRRRS